MLYDIGNTNYYEKELLVKLKIHQNDNKTKRSKNMTKHKLIFCSEIICILETFPGNLDDVSTFESENWNF